MNDAEPLILSTGDLVTPPGRRFWLDDEMFDIDETGMYFPRFSVQEVSKCFFATGPDWIRWRMRPDKPSRRTGKSKHPKGFFVLDGKPMQFKRLNTDSKDPNKQTARYYTLSDIERMAHALAENGVIDGLKLAHVVLMVRCCARLYGVVGGANIFPTGYRGLTAPEPEDEDEGPIPEVDWDDPETGQVPPGTKRVIAKQKKTEPEPAPEAASAPEETSSASHPTTKKKRTRKKAEPVPTPA